MATPVALTAAQAARASEAFQWLRAGQGAAALQIARELAHQAPRAADAQQLLALALVQTGDPAGAEAAFRSALALAPGQPALLGNLATLLRRQGRAAEALPLWQQVTRLQPRLPGGWLDLGQTALELRQTELAQSALNQAVALDPQSARAWAALGHAHRAADDLKAAATAYRRALALDPGRGAVWSNLGAVLRLAGQPAEAAECLARARQTGADQPEVIDAEIGALIDAGRLDEARALARMLTNTQPGYVAGHVTQADLFWEYGDPARPALDPVADFVAAAALRPTDLELQRGLIGFLLEAGRFDDALARIAELRRQADSPLLIALHANALERLGRPELSAPLYAQAHAAFGGREPTFLCAYARHLLKAGHPAAAADCAQQALLVDPDHQESWAYLATAWRLLNDPREDWLCGFDRYVALLAVNTPASYRDQPAFLDALRSTLTPLHQARAAPVRQSLRHGSQTPGRLFGRPDPHLAAAQQALRAAVESWLQSLPDDPTHPFLRRNRRSGIRFTGSWSVQLWQSGRHANHFHNEGWISSAFYVSLPPSVQTSQAGHIQFGQPPEELGLDLPPRRIIQPQPGHLAVFPSYLWHGTVPFHDPEPRLTMAFDMVPRS